MPFFEQTTGDISCFASPLGVIIILTILAVAVYNR
jgi:hypothetical protein